MTCDHNCFECPYDDCICDDGVSWQERIEADKRDQVHTRLTDVQRRKEKEYRDRNREQRNAYAREYYREHREERIAYQIAYAKSHREQVNAAARARYHKRKAAKAAEAAMTAQ